MPPPDDIRLIITSKECRDDDALSALMDADTLSGMIVNEIDSVDSETADLLRAEFPDLNMDAVLVFEQGRAPSSMGLILGSAGGGLALLLGALSLFVVRRRRTPVEVEGIH